MLIPWSWEGIQSRTRDLAEEIRLAKAKGQVSRLDNLNYLWSGYSAILKDREKKLLKKIKAISETKKAILSLMVNIFT